MRYIDVSWLHKSPLEPVRLISELDVAGWERRKLEFFADGRVGFACSTRATDGTALGTAPIPPLAEINAQSELEGIEIDAKYFEELWYEYVDAG